METMTKDEQVVFMQVYPDKEIVYQGANQPRTNRANFIKRAEAESLKQFKTKDAIISNEYSKEMKQQIKTQSTNMTPEKELLVSVVGRLGRLNGMVSKSKEEKYRNLVVTPEELTQVADMLFSNLESYIKNVEEAKMDEFSNNRLARNLMEISQKKDARISALEVQLSKKKELQDSASELLEISQEKDARINALEAELSRKEELQNSANELLKITKAKDETISSLVDENKTLKEQLNYQNQMIQKIYESLGISNTNEQSLNPKTI